MALQRTILLLCTLLVCCYTSVKGQRRAGLRTIVIDAGHGLPDPGAVYAGASEATITLAIAKQLEKQLKKRVPKARVIMTRADAYMPGRLKNTNLANRRRAAIANQYRGDLFISIHVNSSGKVAIQKVDKKKKADKAGMGGGPSGTSTYVWAVNRNDVKRRFASESGGDKKTVGMEKAVMASLRTKQYFARSIAAAGFVESELADVGMKSNGVLQRNNQGIWVLQATAMPSILVETGYITHPKDRAFLNSPAGQQKIGAAIARAVKRYQQFLLQR